MGREQTRELSDALCFARDFARPEIDNLLALLGYVTGVGERQLFTYSVC